jgi:hypothetical protein
LVSGGGEWLAVGGLLLLAALCFWRILDTFFVQDDFALLAAAGKPMPNIEMLRGACFMRPLSSYWLTLLNVSLWGLRPFYHHATYLLVFLATVAALYGWLRSLTGSAPAAFCGATLYAFSKTHLYTLSWIAGGIDVSAALFFVLCLWAVSRCLQAADAGARPSRWMTWAVGITFACAVLCKESCVVIPPAFLAWIAVRKIAARRPFQPAEVRLAVVLVAILAVYLVCWRYANSVTGTEAGRFQCRIARGEAVLQDSVLAVLPAGERSIPRTPCWLLIPLTLAVVAWALRRQAAGLAGQLALAAALWVLPATIFVFTVYPWWLQLYYSHFSVIGLALLAAVAVRSLQAWLAQQPPATAPRWYPRRFALAAAVLLLGAWMGLGGRTIREGIRLRASPALAQADVAKAAYERLAPELQAGQYRQVVLLDVSELMWSTLYGGNMIRLFFPGLRVDCDDRDGFQAPPHKRTDAATLVVRQTGDRSLTIVR